MPPKLQRFDLLSNRQKRRRISLHRANLSYENHAEDSSSSSEISDVDIPLVVEPLVNNHRNVVQVDLNERYDDVPAVEPLDDNRRNVDQDVQNDQVRPDHDNFGADEEIETSDGETISSREGETDEEGHQDGFIEPDEDAERCHRDGSSSSDDDDDNDHFEENIASLARRRMKNAFLSAGLTHKQGNIILKALRENPFNHHYLPKDTRTVLDTPTFVASRFVQEVAGGEYLHIGFKYCILKKLELIPDDEIPEVLIIDFSTDGGALDNEGKWQFWPHQFRIFNIKDQRPMIAAVFKGSHKPSNAHDFYDALITEVNEVIENGGINIRGRMIPLQIRCFIADAPARAMVLNHYSHNSSNACSKCKVEGHRCDLQKYRGTMVFLGTQHPPRTDQEYRNCTDEDHHRGHSPLSLLPMDLVTGVPFESMHLRDLGNVKKIFRAHVHGKYECERLTGRKLDILDARMKALIEYCPSEFGRRPRDISKYSKFKAVEFRQILLYTAPAVLLDVFAEEYYLHFMLLHCVMRLLVSEGTSPVLYDFCQEAIEIYVRTCELLYGEPFMSYNVHGLLHVVDDVRNLGPLETFSAYCYENNMPEFRKRLRKPHLPLQQFCKRVFELEDFSQARIIDEERIQPTQIHSEGPLFGHIRQNCRQYKKIVIGKSTFATNLRDSCFITKTKEIGVIENIVQVNGNFIFIVRYFRVIQQLYNVGLTSQSVGVYHCIHLSNELNSVYLDGVEAKCYRIPKWQCREGQEERIIENEWICVTRLTPVSLPRN